LTAKTPFRICVLGAGGFIGSHLVPALLRETNADIEAVDIDLHKLECHDLRLHKVKGTVRDLDLMGAVTDRCDLVISLTALCNPSLYNTRPLDVIDASYTDLVPLCHRCCDRGRRLIHFSTCEVYGRMAIDSSGERTETMMEGQTSLMLGPMDRERWTYACAKQLLERRIWALGKHHGLQFTIIRPFNVIGPRMDFVSGVDGEGLPRVLACFMGALMVGEPLRLVEGGSHRRTFVGIDDFIQAIVKVVKRPDACAQKILNIGNPENEVSIAELAELISAAYVRQVTGATLAGTQEVTAAEFYGEGYDDSVARIPDISRAMELLDWRPKTSLIDALPPIIDDYVSRYASVLAQSRR